MTQESKKSKNSASPGAIHDIVVKSFRDPLKLPKRTRSSSGELEKYLDLMIPRSGELPECVVISLEDYLSRLAILNRKLLGVRYRKEQWDKLVASHRTKFNQLMQEWPTTNTTEKPRVISGFTLRSINVDNEFEVFLFSVCSTLSMLTKLVAAFLRGNQGLHSHKTLGEVLSRRTEWTKLAQIVKEARAEWINDAFKRRDNATHYVALTAPSIFHGKDIGLKVKIGVAIPKHPEKHVSIWMDDVPALRGTFYLSTRVTEDDGTISETYDLYDMDRRLLIRRVGSLSLPTMIDGIKYVNKTMNHLENHILEVLRELYKRV